MDSLNVDIVEVEEIATEAEEAIKENLETGKPLPEKVCVN